MIELSREVLLGTGTALFGALAAGAKWLIDRAVRQYDGRLDDHERRLDKVESEYVSKEALRGAVVEIKEIIDTWSTDIKRGVENAHGRLDTIYNELLRRAGG